MSALGRLIPRSSVTRRSYSSFGGGRFFNSSKPPKTPVVAAKNKSESSESSSKDSATKASSTSKTANSSSSNPPSNNAQPVTAATSPESSNDQGYRKPGSSAYLGSHPTINPYHDYLGPHPNVNAKDFKIHQFFSLHRPLLLISNPQSMFTPLPNSAPLFRSSIFDSETCVEKVGDKLPAAPAGVLNLDGTYGYNVNVDEDVETARQLHYAMTMHRVAAVSSWEETLKKMGLDVSLDVERVQLREQMDKEWEDVLMDSVKRKRKKKMKKHKLKKRRRATRAERIRIGR